MGCIKRLLQKRRPSSSPELDQLLEKAFSYLVLRATSWYTYSLRKDEYPC